MKDLVILVPDKNIEFALRGALARPEALAICSISYEFRPHMGRDGGARTTGVDVLALENRRFTHALLVFDLEGCGATSDQGVEELERELTAKLQRLWGARAKAIVIAPEADIWIWGVDNALRQAFNWPLDIGIRDWLKTRGFAIYSYCNAECPRGRPGRPWCRSFSPSQRKRSALNGASC